VVNCVAGGSVDRAAQREPHPGALLQRVVSELGPFDVIVDDGSHTRSHMVLMFRQGGLGQSDNSP
jgi:hypothetical protein